MKRSSGILLHITSLPSPYGVGNLGRAAREFVDFLAEAGQRYWQILPIAPTGYGDSPYQATSTFAGNPYLIDPDALVRQGLLTPEELEQDWGEGETQVDFGRLYALRLPLLKKAYLRDAEREKLSEFCQTEAHWLEDYALFMALKTHFGGKAWPQWEADIRLRKPHAMARYRKELAENVGFHKWLQYRFYEQWQSLRDYATGKGIAIIGDIPIYVPLDSCDVWANPEDFQLTRTRRPRVVAGCPPRCLQQGRSVLGQPHLRLGENGTGRIFLVGAQNRCRRPSV